MADIVQIVINGVTYDLQDIGAQHAKPDWNAASGTDAEILNKPDLSQFITRLVADLEYYYLKSETYTKLEVDTLIGSIASLTFEFAQELPAASATTMGKIYLVPSSNPQTQNVKDEYITIRTLPNTYAWEQIGSTELDLSNYYTKTEIDTALGGKVDKVQGKGLSTNDYDDTEKAKVASAYQKPLGGIPAEDLASGANRVLTSSQSAVPSTYDIDAMKDDMETAAAFGITVAQLEDLCMGKYGAIVFGGHTCTVTYVKDIAYSDYVAFESDGYRYELGVIRAAGDTEGIQRTILRREAIAKPQVNADWNANSGKAQILNKPTIPDAVEANPTVPAGTTPAALAGLKVGDGYFSVPDASGKENTSNKVSSWQGTPDDTHYPSEKLVKDSLDGKQATIDNNHKLPYSLLSDTPDLSGFITKSVNDLANYYLKTETYTKSEVEALIAAINQFHYEIYASTSAVTSPATNVLYLIGPTGSGADKYEEYVYSNNAFVKIGDTSIDLSGYVTTSALNTALADYTTTAALTLLLAAKQDVIDSTHKLPYSLISDTPTIPDAVEANPTVPTGTTPTGLTGLKIGSSYFSIPDPTALSNNDIDTIWTNAMS